MRRLMVLAGLLLVAETAMAQMGGGMGGGMGGRRGGGMGGMGGRGGGMERGDREQNMKFPTAKTVEKYNPASLMLDKHKKLSLTDAQQDQLKELRQQIFEKNAPLLAGYDSVQKEYRPPSVDQRGGGQSSPTADSTRRVAMMQMRQLRQLVDSLQDRRRADVQAVLAVLSSDDQRKKAAEFLDKQDIEFTKEFPAPPAQRGGRGLPEDGSQGGFGGRGGRRPPG